MITPIEQHATRVLRERFERLYGDAADRCVRRFAMLCGRYGVGYPAPAAVSPWSEKDAVLITYGDIVQAPGEKPLATLDRFLQEFVGTSFSTLHVLPFFPYSSDDGFSVIHFRQVNPQLGDWSNIQHLAQHYRLMFDLVLNHVSRQSGWFRDFIAEVSPGQDYFIAPDHKVDVSHVVRPRSHPLLTAVSTRNGTRYVWTTFSEDQVDLNFGNPDVLFEILDLMLFYISQGARVIRLDAVAYLWKKIGTSCIHLPEAHEVVKLARTLVDIVAPDVRLLTETNVPHEENISYFGAGDEAHLVYQFSLPPLILHAMVTGEARHLTAWASQLSAPPAGCAFLNFTASHDGIGVRPLQGLVPDAEIAQLTQHVEKRGGRISMKRNSDGTESPYELNIGWFDAMRGTDDGDSVHEKRFLASQAIALSLQGIPAIYFHTLTATPNDETGVKRTGQARSINRHKWSEGELAPLMRNPEAHTAQIFKALKNMIDVRASNPVFHPDAPQRVLRLDDRVFAVERRSPAGDQVVLSLTSCAAVPVSITFPSGRAGKATDLLTGKQVSWKPALELAPYQVVWLKGQAADF